MGIKTLSNKKKNEKKSVTMKEKTKVINKNNSMEQYSTL